MKIKEHKNFSINFNRFKDFFNYDYELTQFNKMIQIYLVPSYDNEDEYTNSIISISNLVNEFKLNNEKVLEEVNLRNDKFRKVIIELIILILTSFGINIIAFVFALIHKPNINGLTSKIV